MYSPLVHGGSNTMNTKNPTKLTPKTAKKVAVVPKKANPPKSRVKREYVFNSKNIPRLVGESAPAAFSVGYRTGKPSICQNSSDRCRIVHRELLASIVGTVNFSCLAANSFPINPGMIQTFPWLAPIARQWEFYKIHAMSFVYLTRTGTSTPGSMILAPDYDAADGAPVSEQIASTYTDFIEDAPWKSIVCTLRPDLLHGLGPKRYVRSVPLAANQDIKTYDSGSLFACTTDGTAVPWGKLYIEYDIELFNPQSNPTGSLADVYQYVTGASPTTAAPLGATSASSNPLLTIAGNVFTAQVSGRYVISLSWDAATSNTLTAPTTTGTFVASMGSGVGYDVSGDTTMQTNLTIIVDLATGQTLTINNTIVLGTAVYGIISVIPKTATI
jgi:hypothetical protein